MCLDQIYIFFESKIMPHNEKNIKNLYYIPRFINDMRIILYRLELLYKEDYGHRSDISNYSVVYAVFEKHIKNMG